jgi:hypothetical protein
MDCAVWIPSDHPKARRVESDMLAYNPKYRTKEDINEVEWGMPARRAQIGRVGARSTYPLALGFLEGPVAMRALVRP